MDNDLKEKEIDTNLKIAILNFLSKSPTGSHIRDVLKIEGNNPEPKFEQIYRYIKSVR